MCPQTIDSCCCPIEKIWFSLTPVTLDLSNCLMFSEGNTMNNILKRTLLPSLMAASLAGVTLVPAKPAAADDQVLRDAGIGAVTNVVTGAVRGRGSVLDNAVKGGVTGAAVNGANGLRNTRNNRRNRNVVQDVGVGAGASAVTGVITGDGKDTLGNAVDGAAVGAAIHLLTNGK
jgi:hypothetical protein